MDADTRNIKIMTTEEKSILIKDLCARLPYKVKIKIGVIYSTELNTNIINILIKCENDIKPYLFPLSSMTDEQKKEITSIICCDGINDSAVEYKTFDLSSIVISFDALANVIRYFNSNHLDYNKLIDKSLAIDATNLNIY